MVDQAGSYDIVGFTLKYLHNKFIAKHNYGIHKTDAESLVSQFSTKIEIDHDILFKFTVDS